MSDCVFDPGIEERLVFEIAHHVLHVRRLNTLKLNIRDCSFIT